VAETVGIQMHGEAEALPLGTRVRAWRKERRLSRRQLALRADISERYLADLETGKANMSIALVSRVATALDTSIASLLSDGDMVSFDYRPLAELMRRLSPQEQRDAYRLLWRQANGQRDLRGVALVGLRGAGKTTLGRKLAERTGASFLPLSVKVEELAGMAVPELIELGGESAFRRYENMALESLASSAHNIVLEAGGGLVMHAESYACLLDNFKVVWIKARPEEHMNRVIQQGDMRPMADNDQAMEDLKLILRQREAVYARADYTLDTAGRPIEACLDELIEVCEPALSA